MSHSAYRQWVCWPMSLAVLAILNTPGHMRAQALACAPAHLQALVAPEAPAGLAPMSPQLFSVFGATPRGSGHLHPEDPELHVRGWDLRMVLPVFGEPALPDDQPGAWMINGFLLQEGQAPSGLYSMARRVEMGGGAPSYLVQERRDDGWLGLRVNSEEDAVWWTHECLLDFGDFPLRFSGVEEALITDFYIADTGLLALRAEPSEDGEPILTFPGGIGGHLLTRLELRGDWMRVRIEVHGYRCHGEPPWEGVDVMEGWVRWRGADGLPNIESIRGVC